MPTNIIDLTHAGWTVKNFVYPSTATLTCGEIVQIPPNAFRVTVSVKLAGNAAADSVFEFFATQAQEDAYINDNTAPSPEDYGDGWQGAYDSATGISAHSFEDTANRKSFVIIVGFQPISDLRTITPAELVECKVTIVTGTAGWYGRAGEMPSNYAFPVPPGRALSNKNSLPLSAWRQDMMINNDFPYISLFPAVERISYGFIEQRDYICVYDMHTDKADFSSNGLAILHPTSAPVHELINGEWTITLTHPMDPDGRWQYILESNLIKCGGQIFTIKRCEWHYETAATGYVVATAEAVFYQLNDLWCYADSAPVVGWYSCEAAIDGVMLIAEAHDAPGSTRYAYEWASEWMWPVQWLRTINADGCTPVELLLGSDGIIAQKGGELYRDNFYFSINERMEGARDDAFDIRLGRNLSGIVRTVDTSQLCLLLRLKDTRTGAWVAVSYDGNAWPLMQFPHNVARSDTVTLGDETYAAIEAGTVDIFDVLFPILFARFNSTCSPVICYDVTLAEARRNPDFQEISVFRYKVGDIGRIYDERLGGAVWLKITETETDGITGEVTRVVFGSKNSFTRPAGYPQTIVIDPEQIEGAFQLRDKDRYPMRDKNGLKIMRKVVR